MLVVNVFDGGPNTMVTYKIGANSPFPMKREGANWSGETNA